VAPINRNIGYQAQGRHAIPVNHPNPVQALAAAPVLAIAPNIGNAQQHQAFVRWLSDELMPLFYSTKIRSIWSHGHFEEFVRKKMKRRDRGFVAPWLSTEAFQNVTNAIPMLRDNKGIQFT
jgi:hypothetical protein